MKLTRTAFSPHARGWPAQIRAHLLEQARSPRTRGDGPSTATPTAP